MISTKIRKVVLIAKPILLQSVCEDKYWLMNNVVARPPLLLAQLPDRMVHGIMLVAVRLITALHIVRER